MTSSEFPGNSKNPQKPADPKKVERVVQSEVVSKKKSLGRRLKDLFIGGDSRTVVEHVFKEILIPQVKDMVTDAASQGFERMIYGENRPGGRRYGARPGTPPGQTNYNRYATRGNNPIGRSGREDRGHATAQPRSQEIDDILFATRVEADTVLERMDDLMREYENVSISDLYSLIGWTSNYTHQKWGWLDLRDSAVQRVRDGYVLNLPRPVPLD